LAQSACTLLMDLIHGKDDNKQHQIILDTELIIRKSCKPESNGFKQQP